MPKFAKLKKDWMLRGWKDVPMAMVNWTTSTRRELKMKGFYVTECCDGQTDFDSLSFLPAHHIVLDRLIEEGIAEACQEGDSIEVWQRYRKAENPSLMGIHWCVTGLCNLNCRHCYMEAPAGRYGELPYEEMAGLIEQLERANVIGVSLTGGEPFLRKDLLDILQLLAQKKIGVNEIYSNGLLITDDHLRGIRRMGFSPVFQISFDGVGGHDRMRGAEGIEQSVIAAIQRLLTAGFPVAVSTSIDKLNLGCLADTYGLMKGLGVHSWSIAPPRAMGNWRGATTVMSLDEEAEAYMLLLERWLNDGKPFDIQLAAFFTGKQPQFGSHGAAPDSKPVETQNTQRNTPDSFDCGACRELPNLLPDGTLVPCPGYVDSPLQERMPNLLRQDLSSVWSQSLLRQIADIKKKDLLARNPECVACELFKACGLGCRASALRETGDLMKKDPVFCDLWKKGYTKQFQEVAASVTGKYSDAIRQHSVKHRLVGERGVIGHVET
jgi:radical SAM protein with 4Fe4S-binding SPASM domain